MNHSEEFFIPVQGIHLPRDSWVQKAQSYEVILSQLQTFCNPRGHCPVWTARTRTMGTGWVFQGSIPLQGSCGMKLCWVPFPCFPPELSPRNPFQQPCYGSVWDGPRGEGWGTSSVQWDCQPRTKSIQMISLANNPTSKGPFRCPGKKIPVSLA